MSQPISVQDITACCLSLYSVDSLRALICYCYSFIAVHESFPTFFHSSLFTLLGIVCRSSFKIIKNDIKICKMSRNNAENFVFFENMFIFAKTKT